MLRSLFSGISGLRAHQTMMDVTGNNIANVNTAGFKASATVFEDTLSQMLKAAGAPQGSSGGTNPAQVGLGVRMAAINTNFSQGAAQNTGRNTDLMINGDGFFVVRAAGEDVFTRSGAFSFDANGKMASPDGGVVQGWTAVNGVVDTNATPGDITLPIGTLLQPTATQNVVVGGNPPADTTSATPLVTSIVTYDAQGNKQTATVQFDKVSARLRARHPRPRRGRPRGTGDLRALQRRGRGRDRRRGRPGSGGRPARHPARFTGCGAGGTSGARSGGRDARSGRGGPRAPGRRGRGDGRTRR